jgi:UDP-N-acetylmuramyl pentapeptide phosphotransferase/UDP-N-acetylglucosamine-1-phosphate transferase
MMDILALLPVACIIWGFAVSALLCALIVATQSWHGRYTLDSTSGLQKFHINPTPRIGGIAVAAGLTAAWCYLTGERLELLRALLLGAAPVLMIGTAEDLSKRVRVRDRLIITMAGVVVACLLSGYSLHRMDVPGLDWALQWTPLAIAVTAFCVAGVANAINIIDGFNGLAAGVVIICTTTIGLIAAQLGDVTLVRLCAVTDAVAAGFLLLNYPFGKIFLGDGGAYLLGFLLGWLAVLLPMRHPEVSAWTSLVICSYPILEVFFSARRKMLRRNCAPHMPDRVHLHMLLHRRVVTQHFATRDPVLRNALTATLVWPFTLAGCAASMVLFNNTLLLIGTFLALGLAYHCVYMRLTHFRWCITWRRTSVTAELRRANAYPSR